MKDKILHMNYWAYVCLAIIIGSFSVSCQKEDKGVPVITNIRFASPETKDSAFKSAGLGQLIVIQGSNLDGATHVYFNDYEATFLPTYNTDKYLMVRIPEKTPFDPEVVNNTVKVVTPNGQVVYNFKTLPPPAIITSISNEWANVGDKVTLYGKYFYFLDSVIFPGNKPATIVSSATDGTSLTVTVPEGAGEGSIRVVTQSGATVSDILSQRFHDSRGIFENFDNIRQGAAGWAIADGVDNASNPQEKKPKPLNGKYLLFAFKNVPSPMWWDNNVVYPSNNAIKFDYAGGAANYALKFEYCPVEIWNSGWVEMSWAWGKNFRFKPWEVGADPTKPWTVTGQNSDHVSGEWITYTIPLNMFRNKASMPDGDPMLDIADADGKGLIMDFQNQEPESKGLVIENLNVCFDNFRIVKVKE